MERRQFVKNAGAMAAGGVLLSGTASSTDLLNSDTKKDIPEVGIQLYSLRNELPNDREGVLKKLSDIGYKYLETYMMDGKHHLGYPIKEYKQRLDDLGLQVMSGHIPTGRTQPDLEGTLVNNLENVIDEAIYLGQQYIVCPYLAESERTSIDDYKRTIDLLMTSGEKCKSAGITFAYHNHEFEFEELDGEIPMDLMIKGTDPELVQIELDIYWSTRANRDAIKLFNKYPRRFPLWHVKDMNKEKPEETTYLGGGSIDYTEVFQKSKKSGMEYYFVEQEHYPIPVYDGVQKSFDYLMAIKNS